MMFGLLILILSLELFLACQPSLKIVEHLLHTRLLELLFGIFRRVLIKRSRSCDEILTDCRSGRREVGRSCQGRVLGNMRRNCRVGCWGHNRRRRVLRLGVRHRIRHTYWKWRSGDWRSVRKADCGRRVVSLWNDLGRGHVVVGIWHIRLLSCSLCQIDIICWLVYGSRAIYWISVPGSILELSPKLADGLWLLSNFFSFPVLFVSSILTQGFLREFNIRFIWF